MNRLDGAFIVAEISKTWINGHSLTEGLLCQHFERVLAVNHARGYRLHSFQLHQFMASRATDAGGDDQLVETIIAVFERVAPPPSADAVDPSAPDPGTPTTRDKV